MKKCLPLVLLACASMAIISSCKKKPTDNIKLNINADVIKYTANISISDIMDDTKVPANVAISIAGADAQYVYDLFGTKDFTVNNGSVAVGLSPTRIPAVGQPVSFTVKVSAQGYLPMYQNVTINTGQMAQRVKVQMLNYVNPPPGLTVKTGTYQLSNGVLGTAGLSQLSRTTDTVYYDNGICTLVLPAGATFTYDSVYTPILGGKNYYVTSTGITTPLEVAVLGKANVQRGTYTGSVVTWVSVSASTVPAANDYQGYDLPSGVDNNPMIRLLNGSSAAYSHLLLTSAAKQKLYGIHFLGVSNSYSPYVDIDIYPDPSVKWFISSVLDPQTMNPQTNQLIKDGDLIEAGVDYENDSTYTTVIKKDPLGNLRVQAQSTELGYYKEAPYQVSYNYSVNTTVDSTVLPDPENLSVVITPSIVDNKTGDFINFPSTIPYNAGTLIYAKSICSEDPIAVASPTYVARYFDALEVLSSFSSVPNYFNNDFIKQLQPQISFLFSLSCQQSNKTIYPSCYFSALQNNGGNFICHVVNGVWKTKGLKPGTYDFQGYISGHLVGGDPLVVTAGQNNISVKTDDNVCALFE